MIMSHFQSMRIDLTEEEIFSLPTGDEVTEECTGAHWNVDISEASEESLFQTLLVDSDFGVDGRVEDEVLEAVERKGSEKGECHSRASSKARVTRTRKQKMPSSFGSGRRRKKLKSWREFEMEKAQMGMLLAERKGVLTTSSRLHCLPSLFPNSRLKHPFAPNLLQAQPVGYCMFAPQTPSLAELVRDFENRQATNMIAPTTLHEADRSNAIVPTTTIGLSEVFAGDGPHEPNSISSAWFPEDTPMLNFLKLDVLELEAILAAGAYKIYIH